MSPTWTRWTPWVALLGAAILCYLGIRTPAPLPESVAATEFSASRAMADVRALGAAPHPVGSDAHRTVRDYVLARMTALGLAPRLQEGSAFEVYGSHASGASVSNVVGLLPGKDPSAPVLALMAHYDSVPGSPGAADDAAGVSSALEIIRALQARGTPDRDVAVVLTDGEEAGLLGARVFFDQDPLAGRVGYVVNLETRGGGGRAEMFETAPGNGGDIELFRRTAGMPNGNALTVFVYQRLPNDTDFTIARQHGKAGLNYAFIGRQFDYHSPSSTPAALDQGALQHMGTEVLPTVAALAFGPLPDRAPDVVYGDLFGWCVPAYPTGFGWVVLLALAGAWVLSAARLRRERLLRAAEIARGVGASVFVICFSGVALECARRLTGVETGWIEYRPLLARFRDFEAMMGLSALGALVLTLACARRGGSRWAAAPALALGLLGGFATGFDPVALVIGLTAAIVGLAAFGTPTGFRALWLGLTVLPLLAAAALQVLAPTVAFIVAWPLAVAVLVFWLAGPSGGWIAVGLRTAIAAVALGWLGVLFHSLLESLDVPALGLLPVWLAAPLLLPLLDRRVRAGGSGPVPGGVLLALGLCAALFLRWSNPWSPRHPAPAEPVYVVDPAGQKAWVASLLAPDAWVGRVLRSFGSDGTTVSVPLDAKPVAAVTVPAAAVAGAQVRLETTGPGQMLLTVAPPPGAARVVVSLTPDARIDSVRINGASTNYVAKDGTAAELIVEPGHRGRVTWAGPSGFTLAFHAGGGVQVETAAIYDRWMAPAPLPAMPPSDEPWNFAGDTLVLGSVAASPARVP